MHTTLILGIGNVLLRDEGIGVHVVRHLDSECCHPDSAVTFMDGGTLSLSLAAEIEEHDQLIVIDAAQLGRTAGSVCCFVGEEMDRFLGASRRSVHEVSLLDLVDIARLTSSLPEKRALIGIQPQDMAWGETPSPPLKAAIPAAAEYVSKLLAAWHEQPETDLEQAS